MLSRKGVGGSKWFHMVGDGWTDIFAKVKSREKLLVRVEA